MKKRVATYQETGGTATFAAALQTPRRGHTMPLTYTSASSPITSLRNATGGAAL
jgi:hypothetical protein